jgi:hypothetical protein
MNLSNFNPSFLSPYSDASGAPAVLSHGGYVFAMDFIAGEVTCNCIRPASGSRTASKVAVAKVRANYKRMIERDTTADWRARNVALYASVAP